MKQFFAYLLPEKADNTFSGRKLPILLFAIITLFSLVRSLIHLLSPDGGAGSIAGMDLSLAGADGIIFAFALWGSAQLIYALIQLLVLLRYRALIPLMYLLLIVETLLRILVGSMKPVGFAHTPPGALGNQILLPLALGMLVLSFWPAKGKVR
jgi:hypothetical protein